VCEYMGSRDPHVVYYAFGGFCSMSVSAFRSSKMDGLAFYIVIYCERGMRREIMALV
jgi:hypothetical protein